MALHNNPAKSRTFCASAITAQKPHRLDSVGRQADNESPKFEGRPSGVYYPGRQRPFYADGSDILCVFKEEMPRIDDNLLDCVIYLYESADHAKEGTASGGTGFLVVVKSETHKELEYIYAVSNSHVVRDYQSPVVRLNTHKGDTDVLNLKSDDWQHHPDGDDVAAVHLGGIDRRRYKFKVVPTELFITHEAIKNFEIGPGDEVFMLGRFIGHDGKQRNTPSVRFGNISMMPGEPIPHLKGFNQESFVVETRSLGGYSGSPVFVHTPFDEHHFPGPKRKVRQIMPGGPWLLGVDWGHSPICEQVLEPDGETPVSQGYVVSSNSGMMNVVPAWRLPALLNQEEFREKRKKCDEKITEKKNRSSVVLDAEIPIDPDGF